MLEPIFFIFCIVFSTHAADNLPPQLASIDQSSWHKRRKDKEAQAYTTALRELMKHVGNKKEINEGEKRIATTYEVTQDTVATHLRELINGQLPEGASFNLPPAKERTKLTAAEELRQFNSKQPSKPVTYATLPPSFNPLTAAAPSSLLSTAKPQQYTEPATLLEQATALLGELQSNINHHNFEEGSNDLQYEATGALCYAGAATYHTRMHQFYFAVLQELSNAAITGQPVKDKTVSVWRNESEPLSRHINNPPLERRVVEYCKALLTPDGTLFPTAQDLISRCVVKKERRGAFGMRYSTLEVDFRTS